jgi:hypothetical protein
LCCLPVLTQCFFASFIHLYFQWVALLAERLFDIHPQFVELLCASIAPEDEASLEAGLHALTDLLEEVVERRSVRREETLKENARASAEDASSVAPSTLKMAMTSSSLLNCAQIAKDLCQVRTCPSCFFASYFVNFAICLSLFVLTSSRPFRRSSARTFWV